MPDIKCISYSFPNFGIRFENNTMKCSGFAFELTPANVNYIKYFFFTVLLYYNFSGKYFIKYIRKMCEIFL